jgi:hypothetical protein
MLVGKQIYLRGGYLGDTLNFDEHGHIVGHSPQGSYTLSVIQIDHVRLTKHKVELEGTRYGLHFNEQLAYEDSSEAYDKVRITPKKKVVRITIDREMVVNPKKKKEPSKEKGKTKPARRCANTGSRSGPHVGGSRFRTACHGGARRNAQSIRPGFSNARCGDILCSAGTAAPPALRPSRAR